MTKIRNTLWAAIVAFLICMPAYALTQPTISGPDEAVVGEEVMLTINFPAGNYETVSGKLDWDSKTLQLQGYEISPYWEADFLEKEFTLTKAQPGAGDSPWICLTYRVGNAPEGTKLSLFCSDVVADGETEFSDAVFTFTVGKRLSQDNTLTQLILENGTLSPQFHPEIMAYTAKVNPGQTHLKLQAVAGEKAAVEVDAPRLSGDAVTRVSITVTAENGDKRVYRIDVDPVKSQSATEDSTQATEPATQNSDKGAPSDSQDSGFPWWAAVAAVFAGSALGGGVVIVIEKTKKRNR